VNADGAPLCGSKTHREHGNFSETYPGPACRRPELRKIIPAQDLCQQIKVKGRKAGGGLYEFLQAACQRRSVKSLDQCSLGTGHLQQHSLTLDPARSELLSGAGLHGKRRIQEANGKPIQKKGTAAPDPVPFCVCKLPPAPFLFYCGLQVTKASDPAITNDPA
jgi:hypothetical protein